MIKLTQFVKLMMMTTSQHDAEALTAVRKANSLLAAEGKNWEELITGLVPIENDRQQQTYSRRPRTETPPWADDQDIDILFAAALERVRPGTSFRATIEGIQQWWLDKGFLTQRQMEVLMRAAGRQS